MDEQRAAYVALAMTQGMGPVRLRTLLSACETPLGAYSAPFAFLCALPSISRAAASAIKASSPERGQRILGDIERLGGQVLLPSDDGFPSGLRNIPDPPLLLFALGDAALLRRPAVAMVGSRDHTSYGAAVCRRFALDFATAGGVVVSGMARGLDAVAHRAALDAGGATVGVLGNGLGVVYPAANRVLYEQVGERGLLLTEFPPGERPHAGSFPRRNRLISGVSRVVVVVEAALGSGALITADTALNQGREVVAVPGPITSATSAGTNRLIRDGAAPLLEPADLFDYYPELTYAASGSEGTPADPEPPPRPPELEQALAPLPDTLSDAERAVANLLTGTPRHIDDVAVHAARPVHEVLATLCGLELAGVVEQQTGRRFRRR